jgi:cell filamentation protein
MAKYDIQSSQGLYQPGSVDKVLANKLDIIRAKDMDEAELVLLEKLYKDVLLDNFSYDAGITVTDIKAWHRRWLGNVYEWAGAERSVNMSKGDFHFFSCRSNTSVTV